LDYFQTAALIYFVAFLYRHSRIGKPFRDYVFRFTQYLQFSPRKSFRWIGEKIDYVSRVCMLCLAVWLSLAAYCLTGNIFFIETIPTTAIISLLLDRTIKKLEPK
jgi:hypothetical protein